MQINDYIINGATNKGTKVVEKGKSLDKNSFFKILAAQLMNQDPSKPADSTQFVAQLAQFTTLEEMENLNNTMSFQSATGLVGKTVAVDSYNYKGEQYGGIVKAVEDTSAGPQVIIDVIENNKIEEKKFKLSDVSNVINMPNPYLVNMNGNMDFNTVSSMIGKDVKVTGADAVYSGTIKSSYKSKQGVKAIVETSGRIVSGKMEKSESYNEIDVFLNGEYKGDSDIRIKLKFAPESENKYSYKIIEQDNSESDWVTYEPDTEVRGVKLLLPKEDPTLPCNWTASIKKFETSEIHVTSSNILEVGE